MKTMRTIAALMLAGTAVLSGCASNSPQSSVQSYPYEQVQSDYGTIDTIRVTRVNTAPNGSGAAVGGLVGALVGNQVGSGGGRTAATIAGAVGGAVVGNQLEANRTQGQDMYEIGVRLDNGAYRTVTQASVNDLRVGNRVRVVDGHAYRY